MGAQSSGELPHPTPITPRPPRAQGAIIHLVVDKKLIIYLPTHPEGRQTPDLAVRSHAGFSLEETAFFLLQGRRLWVREAQGCFMRRSSQEPKIVSQWLSRAQVLIATGPEKAGWQIRPHSPHRDQSRPGTD